MIMDNLQTVGPIFAGIWIVTILFSALRPQRFFNSFLLMAALLVTMLFLSGFFGENGRIWFLLISFLLVMLGLFMVPLLLGIVVGVGELASVIYVLGQSDYEKIGPTEPWVVLVILTVFYFSFLVLCFVVYTVFIQIMPHRMNFNYVIIHGCGLADGDRMTKLLSNRVDKAIEIYRKCKVKPVIIPSGGQGSDEKLSEAQAMKDYLLSRGIPEESIRLEDRSATTRENLQNSKAIIDAGTGRKKTALVSSNYHIYRCLRLAREMGLRCTGIGAKVALYYWPSALIREFIAVFVTKRFLIWSLIGYLLFISPELFSLMR